MNALMFQSLLLLLGAFLIGCILGCWLKRLFSDDQPPVKAPEKRDAAPAAAAPAGAFDWMAVRTSDAIILEGLVPTTGDRNRIVEDSQARFEGLTVENRMTIGGKVPAGASWTDATNFALGQLEGLASGDVSLLGTDFSIRGVAASKSAYDSIRKSVPANLPSGLSLGAMSIETPSRTKPAAPAKPKSKPASKPAKVKAAPIASKAAADGEIIAVKSDRELAGTQPKGLRAARGGAADDLKRIRGIGKVNEAKLNAFGIWHFDQIASWTKDEIDWVDDFIAFPGRIEREEWVSQAKTLAKGGETSFSKRVDAGEVESSAGGPSKKPKS